MSDKAQNRQTQPEQASSPFFWGGYNHDGRLVPPHLIYDWLPHSEDPSAFMKHSDNWSGNTKLAERSEIENKKHCADGGCWSISCLQFQAVDSCAIISQLIANNFDK